MLLLLLSNKCTTLHFIKNRCNIASFTHADVWAKFCSEGAECLLGHLTQTRPSIYRVWSTSRETAENSIAGSARSNRWWYSRSYMWGVAKIFTSGHSKVGFNRTPPWLWVCIVVFHSHDNTEVWKHDVFRGLTTRCVQRHGNTMHSEAWQHNAGWIQHLRTQVQHEFWKPSC